MAHLNKVATRSGSVSSLTAVGTSVKKSRDDVSKQSDDGEIESLDALWNKMQLVLTDHTNRIEKKIETCNTILEKRISDIEKQLVTVRDECSDNIHRLKEAFDIVRSDVDCSIEAVQRMDKNKDLIISGIPYQSCEDLQDVFRKIAVSVGCDENRIPLVDLHRLARAPISSGMTPPILCEFALRNNRNEFYRMYLSKRSLCLHDVDFENGNRIYINENLSTGTRQIRTAAIKLKKLGQVQNVFARNGTVFIKPNGSDNSKAIHSLEQIAAYVKNPIQQ